MSLSEQVETLARRSGASPVRAHAVGAVIDEAEHHPLGVQFLMEGSLEAVAIMYHAHPAAVEDARRWLRSGACPREAGY